MIQKITIENWIIINAGVMVIGGIGAIYALPLRLFLVINLLSFLVLIFLGRPTFQQWSPYGGYANWVTFFRYLLLLITIILIEHLPNIQLFILFSLCLLLDGVDGQVARHFQQQSDWGALFDKEVDSFFVLIISLTLYQYFDIPIWILGIGLLHYLYELLLYFLNWQHITTAKNPIGRYVAFLLFAGLLIPIISNQSWVLILLGIISLLTLVSFGVSFSMKYLGWIQKIPNE